MPQIGCASGAGIGAPLAVEERFGLFGNRLGSNAEIAVKLPMITCKEAQPDT